MISMNQLPTTGTPASGKATIGSWLTCESVLENYASTSTSQHLQIAGVVPAANAPVRPFAGIAADGTDAARKRGRPPRGEPR